MRGITWAMFWLIFGTGLKASGNVSITFKRAKP